MLVLLYTADLMLPSQLAGTAAQCGVGLATVASPAALQQVVTQSAPQLALIDLSQRDLDLAALVATLRGLPRPPVVVAYGPHVQTALLESARAAGCQEVLARGEVFRGFRGLLERYVLAGAAGQ